MAFGQSFNAKPEPPKGTMGLYGLNHVVGTTWLMPTRRGEHWTDEPLIELYRKYEKPPDHGSKSL